MSDNHNHVQDLCSDLTALDENPEFAIEPLYGVRQWFMYNIQSYPALTGFYHEHNWPFSAQTHVATCERQRQAVSRETEILNLRGTEIQFRDVAGRLAADLVRGIKFPELHEEAGSSSLSLRFGATHADNDVYDGANYFSPSAHSYNVGLTLYGDPDRAFDQLELVLANSLRTLVGSTRDLNATNWRYGFGAKLITHQVWQHPVATPSCTCGFYAYHTRQGLVKNMHRGGTYNAMTFGLVKASGHVTVGSQGLRMERCEIVALTPALVSNGVAPGPCWELPGGSYDADLFSGYCRQFGLQTVSSLTALLNLATEYGIMLDREHDGYELRSQLPPLPPLLGK